MSEFAIEVEGGSSVRLPTAGKYCDRDIVVTATGGGEEVFTDGYYALPYTKKLSNLFNGKASPGKDIYRESLHLEEVEYLYNGIIKLNYTFYGCTSLKKAYLPKATGFMKDGFFQTSHSAIVLLCN